MVNYIVLYGIIIILLYIIFNLYRKNKKLEELTNKISQHMQRVSEVIIFSDKKLKEVDERGSFKSDDEVGFFFICLQGIQSVLNQFIIDINGTTSIDKNQEKA